MSSDRDGDGEFSSLLDEALEKESDESMASSNPEEPLFPPQKENFSCKWCCSLKSLTNWLLTNLLLILTVASVVVGIIIGLSVREVNMDPHSNGYRVMVQLVGFPGEIFLRMLQMLILPLIVFSLIAGLGSLETKVAGSLGWKTVLYYGTTTLIAVILGLVLVSAIKPGEQHIDLNCDNSTQHDLSQRLDTLDSILDLLRYADQVRPVAVYSYLVSSLFLFL